MARLIKEMNGMQLNVFREKPIGKKSKMINNWEEPLSLDSEMKLNKEMKIECLEYPLSEMTLPKGL